MTDFSGTVSPHPVRPERSMIVRILAALFWLVPIYFLVFTIAGVIAGAMSLDQLPQQAAGSMAEAYEQGATVGRQAAQDMLRAHVGKLLLIIFGLTGFLSYKGILPGTGKYKRVKA